MGDHAGLLAERIPGTGAPGRHRARQRSRWYVLPGVMMTVAGGLSALALLLPSGQPGAPAAVQGTPAASTLPSTAQPGTVQRRAVPPEGTAATRPPSPAPAPPAPVTRTYTVRTGDSAWSIAYRQCGDGNDWRALRNGNKSLNMWDLLPGQSLDLTC